MKTHLRHTSHRFVESSATRHRGILTRFAMAALLLAVSVGAAAASSKEQQREDLHNMVQATLADLYRQQPAAQDVINRAAGYAVFSSFGTKLGFAGTGKGKGVAVDNPSGKETYMKMVELQAGLGFGVKKYRLIWVFESQGAFDNFVSNGRQFGGQAAFNARASGKGGGVAGAASVDTGVWLYQLTDDGLAAEITVKASKYFKDKDLN